MNVIGFSFNVYIEMFLIFDEDLIANEFNGFLGFKENLLVDLNF